MTHKSTMRGLPNAEIAHRLLEAARLLEDQGGNPFRIRAYRQAASTIERLPEPVATIVDREGLAGLTRLPTIGPSLARSIHLMGRTGQFPMLARLQGEHDAEALLATVPGIGRVLAERLHRELGIETLEALETAAHSGRLATLPGIGTKRLAGIVDALAGRLGRRPAPAPALGTLDPAVGDLLRIDRDYRREAERGHLILIAPRRFNPSGARWLPIMHAELAGRYYTALFSNTARAHRLRRTRDWVVIYHDGRHGDGQCTVVTEYHGPMKGRRVVRGRELECWQHYYGEGTQISA